MTDCPAFLHEWAVGKLLYLASPYTHPEAAIRERRFEKAVHAAAFLMALGAHIYSPIAHTHPIATRHDLPKGWEYWQEYDRTVISRCDALLVLQCHGWDKSKGVAAEVEIARTIGMPVLALGYPCTANDFRRCCSAASAWV